MSPGATKQKQARTIKSKVKTMTIRFVDGKGILGKGFVSPGQTVSQNFSRKVLDRLRKRVIGGCPGMAKMRILHHDNSLYPMVRLQRVAIFDL